MRYISQLTFTGTIGRLVAVSVRPINANLGRGVAADLQDFGDVTNL